MYRKLAKKMYDFFLHGLIFIKGNWIQKNSQFCWINFKNGQKDYFLLPKIFELLPANLNFSQKPEDFQIHHMVYI